MDQRTTTEHGYPILDRKPARDGGEMIVADLGTGRPHRWVCWHMYANGVCVWGDYCSTYGEAREAFAGRA